MSARNLRPDIQTIDYEFYGFDAKRLHRARRATRDAELRETRTTGTGPWAVDGGRGGPGRGRTR